MTKEPHRSSGASCATVTPMDAVIDAVRCAHQHPTLPGILRSVFLREGSMRVRAGHLQKLVHSYKTQHIAL